MNKNDNIIEKTGIKKEGIYHEENPYAKYERSFKPEKPQKKDKDGKKQ